MQTSWFQVQWPTTLYLMEVIWGNICILLFYWAQLGRLSTSTLEGDHMPCRYPLINLKTKCSVLQLTCISGNRASVNCQDRIFLRFSFKSRVLQLVGIHYLCKTVPALVQNVTCFSWDICIRTNSLPNLQSQHLGEVISLSTNEYFPDQEKCSFINSEWMNNITQVYNANTLYLHFMYFFYFYLFIFLWNKFVSSGYWQ